MQQLADIEESLTLFTEGIAGRYLHIKASEEFVSHLGLKLDLLGAGQTKTPSTYLISSMHLRAALIGFW